MASLIAVCCHDNVENGRLAYTKKTLESFKKTVDFTKHRLFIADNGSYEETKLFLKKFQEENSSFVTVITNEENLGTAMGINNCWKYKKQNEFCCKCDNDLVIHTSGWIEQMEEAITRMPEIGILGLKRKDLWEHPAHENLDFRSRLIMAPHETGQRWIVVEQAPHIIGTCQMFNPALLDKIGYLKQPGVYGFDDTLASLRSQIAGFKNCFLPHIEIEHIDVGGDDYCKWKQREADRSGNEFAELRRKYQSGEIPVYYNPFEG